MQRWHKWWLHACSREAGAAAKAVAGLLNAVVLEADDQPPKCIPSMGLHCKAHAWQGKGVTMWDNVECGPGEWMWAAHATRAWRERAGMGRCPTMLAARQGLALGCKSSRGRQRPGQLFGPGTGPGEQPAAATQDGGASARQGPPTGCLAAPASAPRLAPPGRAQTSGKGTSPRC